MIKLTKSIEEERRLTFRVGKRWGAQRGNRPFGRGDQIDANSVGDDWRYCFVLDLGNQQGPFFRDVGPAHGPFAGRRVCDCPEDSLLRIAAGFSSEAIEKRGFVVKVGQAQCAGRALLYRATLLPLSSDGTRLDQLLGAVNCREIVFSSEEFPPEHRAQVRGLSRNAAPAPSLERQGTL
jgi:hypothetical protein